MKYQKQKQNQRQRQHEEKNGGMFDGRLSSSSSSVMDDEQNGSYAPIPLPPPGCVLSMSNNSSSSSLKNGHIKSKSRVNGNVMKRRKREGERCWWSCRRVVSSVVLCISSVYLVWITFVLLSFQLPPTGKHKEGDALYSAHGGRLFLSHFKSGWKETKKKEEPWDMQVDVVDKDADINSQNPYKSEQIKRNKEEEEEVIILSEQDLQSWTFNHTMASLVQNYFSSTLHRKSPLLTAYTEPPLPSTTNNSSTANSNTPQLPLRTQSPQHLQKHTYPRVSTCSQLQATLPVNHPPSLNDKYRNVNNRQPMHPHRHDYAKYCPVDLDPFLPWLHDVFPTIGGGVTQNTYLDEAFLATAAAPSNIQGHVEFMAQNKRRCNTGIPKFQQDLDALGPQVAIMQPVPVVRMTEEEARSMAPSLWHPHDDNASNAASSSGSGGRSSRYRLATSYEQADTDARETRFLCRFHTYQLTTNNNNHKLQKVILGETLSTYPYNYEYANFRKPNGWPMLSPGGKAVNAAFWNSVQHFRCPIPTPLVKLIASGETVVDDVASIYVDMVPIRTPPRQKDEEFLSKEQIGVKEHRKLRFDAKKVWGEEHVLPRVEASGRWANIPVCLPPRHYGDGHGGSVDIHGNPVETVVDTIKKTHSVVEAQPPQKPKPTTTTTKATKQQLKERPHTLIGCLWASASYTTRGNAVSDTSTSLRLLEWLTYHLDVAGFDHIYIYDNTGANTPPDDNTTSLEHITKLFGKEQVTRIVWPHRVCNNNVPAHVNTGERSSQYAAEASCRVRYGRHAEWLASFDTDEYLIPTNVEKYRDLKEWLKEGVEKEAKVLSFRSTRAMPDVESMVEYRDESKECSVEKKNEGEEDEDGGHWPCLIQRKNATYLETYNCEFVPLPKPEWAMRAKKQIYRPWYVLNHYVHYATISQGLLQSFADYKNRGLSWHRNYREPAWSERFVDEVKEVVMIHAKTTAPKTTSHWRKHCQVDYVPKLKSGADKCRVGIVHTHMTPVEAGKMYGLDHQLGKLGAKGDEASMGKGKKEATEEGFGFTCYAHPVVRDVFVPKLREVMERKYGDVLEKLRSG